MEFYRFSQLKFKDLMLYPIDEITAQSSFGNIISIMIEKDVEMLPIVGHSRKVIGYISLKKIFKYIDYPSFLTMDIRSLLTEDNFLKVSAEEQVETYCKTSHDIFIVVNESGKEIGFITNQDLNVNYNQFLKDKMMTLELVFESSDSGICAINKEGIIIAFNPAAERMSRVSKERALGTYLADVIVPKGLFDVLNTNKMQQSAEYSVGNKDYLSTRTPIRNSNGKAIGAVGIFQEISNMKNIYKELDTIKSLNNELKTAINSSYDGIIIVDLTGRIMNINTAANSILNIKDIEESNVINILDLLGRSISSLVEKSVVDKESHTSFLVYKEKHLIITVNPVIHENGDISRLMLNVRDIKKVSHVTHSANSSTDFAYNAQVEMLDDFQNVGSFIYNSKAMEELRTLLDRVAKVESTVLIRGESGTGKEKVAEYIHENSKQKDQNLIKVNCGAIPESLLESELFGYAPGAFTGADRKGKQGLFEKANKGTILLDEIGDIPLNLQVKILRVLQEKEIKRIGETVTRPIDVRILSATNKNLEKAIEQKEFREDLYYRLNVIPVHVPPLRERKADILPLISFYGKKLQQQEDLQKEYTAEALSELVDYRWPGNVRELVNIVERLYVTCPGNIITTNIVKQELNIDNKNGDNNTSTDSLEIRPLKEAVFETEKEMIELAINKHGSTYEAAKVLGVNQSTIVRKLKRIREYNRKDDQSTVLSY